MIDIRVCHTADSLPRPLQYFPDVAGGECLQYRIKLLFILFIGCYSTSCINYLL